MSIALEIEKIYPASPIGNIRPPRQEDSERQLRIAQACDEMMKRGREQEGMIFLSKFNPVFPPPNLLWNRTIEQHALRVDPDFNADQRSEGEIRERYERQVRGEVVDREEPPRILDGHALREYKTRSPHGIPELHENLNQWLEKQGIAYADYDKDEPRFVCANSVNSTLLPRLFQMRKSGGIFSQKQNEVAYFSPAYGLLPFNAYDANLTITQYKTSKEHQYKPTAAKIRNLLKNRISPDKLRAVALINPANPTGACLSKEEVDAIADVIATHNEDRAKRGVPPVLVIVDETFRNLMWDGQDTARFYPFAKNEKLRPYTISLNTLSKDMGPGLGFAYAYGPPDLIKQIAVLDGPSYEAQLYAAQVFSPAQERTVSEHRNKSVAFYKERYAELKKYIAEDLNPALRKKFGGDQDYVSILGEPDAGFHVALDFSGLRGATIRDNGVGIPLDTSAHIAVALMEKAKVAMYPGEMFYLDGADMVLRASLNLEPERLLEAMRRVKDFCLNLEPPTRQYIRATESGRQGIQP